MKEHRTLGKQLVWFCVAAVLFSAVPVSGEQVTGFVTQIDSPTEFSVGSLRVVLNGKTRCETEDLRADIELKRTRYLLGRNYYLLQSRPDPKSELAASCDALPLRVGFRVLVDGDRGLHDGSIAAAQLVVYKVDIQRSFSTSWKPPEWAGSALLEEQPQVSRTAQGWAGTLWLDGYPMVIAPETKLLAAPDVKGMGIGSFFQWLEPQYEATILHRKAPVPAFSASLFQPNTWATYQGARRADGHIVLDRIGLWPNRSYSSWEKYSKEVVPTIHPPEYASHASGSAVFTGRGFVQSTVLSILPYRNVQGFVSRLGASLIPQYQRMMPETSAAKIHFRFYIVQSAGAAFDDEVSNVDNLPYWLVRPSWDDAVLALPNGVILVPASTLTGVGSEAHLAAILSSAIASVLQEQSYIAWYEGSKYAYFSTVDWAAFWPGFVLWRDEQAIRIGIRQMYLAGYDIREAPIAWAAALGKPVSNPVPASGGSTDGIPWYTAYAFDYLSRYYSDVNYCKLRRGRTSYAEFLRQLRSSDPQAFATGRK